MPKNKQFSWSSKKAKGSGKTTAAGPETSNEFLSAGVENEESGEKWRAGDAVKSARAFCRAIEIYDAGLKIFPQSMDLAFNKARLQYDLSQQPRLMKHLEVSPLDQLRLALDSHRIALAIESDETNLMYNTAQVLRSLAEGIEQDKAEYKIYESLRMYQDAFEIFEKCLKTQEEILARASLEDADPSLVEAASHDEDAEMADAHIQPASPEEKWVAIVEGLSEEIILDTIIGLIGTMTNICALISNQDMDEVKSIEENYHTNLERIDEYFKKTIHTKLHKYSKPNNTSREDEIMLAVANYTCAYAEASFRTGRTSILNYDKEVKLAFSPERLSSTSTGSRIFNSPEALCDKANAEISFALSIQSKLPNLLAAGSLCSFELLNNLRWTHLTTALEAATEASKQDKHEPGILPRIHLLRGDCEVLRYRLREAPCNYVLAVRSREKLLKNADKYYRGAAAFAQNENAAEEHNEAVVKSAVVWALLGYGERLDKLAAKNLDMLRDEVEEMEDEELLSKEDSEVIRRLFPWRTPDPANDF